jgi:DNA-binding SARP family transcriptional activator
MRLLWKSGRRDEALRQYESCRRSLREELGVGPARETQALYACIAAEAQTVPGDLGTDTPEAPTGLLDS